jgi:bifunctional non-homologous end joining protein LigD
MRDVRAKPELATLIDAPFDDPGWLFEIKWDGIRALVSIDARGRATITSRTGNDLKARFPELARIGDSFSERPLLVDGEIVVLDEKGRSSFQRLQRSRSGAQSIRFVAFDALYADGRDLRGEPLLARKRILASRVRPENDLVLYSQHVVGAGTKLYAAAKARGLEGIVGKRCDSPYREKRTRDWVKIKVRRSQECVVGGFTDPKGGRVGFGSLVCGVYDDGALRYVGHVGSGFDAKAIAMIHARLAKRETSASPFAAPIPRRGARTHWVKPELVAQVAFTEWTADERMRQPTFEGLREDKRASEVVLERAAPTRAVRARRSEQG